MMKEFELVLQTHRERYPMMEPQDYGKLLFQSEFGPEHLVSDPEAVLRYLKQEWSELQPCCVPVEPESIGNGLCRYHLSACTEEQLPRLAEVFCRSAQEHKGTREGLEERIALVRALNVPGMEEWLERFREAGYPPVRHSQTFRHQYAPHYRVIKLEYAGEI